MSKIKNITTFLFVLFLLTITASSVLAYPAPPRPVSETTLDEVTYSYSRITVKGTSSGDNQVQVIVFDDNEQPIYFTTVEVEDNAFDKTLDAEFDLESGKTYIVKVSNYDGTGVSEGSFTVEAEDPNVKDETPKTGIIEYIGISVLIITMSVLGVSKLKKKEI